MQLVINIDDKLYEIIKNPKKLETMYHAGRLCEAVRNGTPLPKGHGALIDADKFLKDNEAYMGWILNSSEWGGENAYKDTLEDLVNEADTIIEADKEAWNEHRNK